jgi:hypothetical protein
MSVLLNWVRRILLRNDVQLNPSEWYNNNFYYCFPQKAIYY